MDKTWQIGVQRWMDQLSIALLGPRGLVYIPGDEDIRDSIVEAVGGFVLPEVQDQVGSMVRELRWIRRFRSLVRAGAALVAGLLVSLTFLGVALARYAAQSDPSPGGMPWSWICAAWALACLSLYLGHRALLSHGWYLHDAEKVTGVLVHTCQARLRLGSLWTADTPAWVVRRLMETAGGEDHGAV